MKKIFRISALLLIFIVLSSLCTYAEQYGVITGSVVNFRKGPSTSTGVIRRLNRGTAVTIVSSSGSWVKISYNDTQGYVHSDYVDVRDGALPSRSGGSSVKSKSSSRGSEVSDYAASFLGVRYVYGGASPKGFDCSGLTQYVYKHFGYNINRTAAAQASNGKYVSKSNLQPGDLVFFNTRGGISHVGMYVGNGQFIHSPNSNSRVKYESLNSSYYKSRYVTARRIV